MPGAASAQADALDDGLDREGGMQSKGQQRAFRSAHLMGAALIGTSLYWPWGNIAWFALLNQGVVFPALAISGLWMWLAPCRRGKQDL
ncbi:MAG: hypothetical protein ACX94A_01340 [Algiphilus sp.]